jgi:hypothetical protein
MPPLNRPHTEWADHNVYAFFTFVLMSLPRM